MKFDKLYSWNLFSGAVVVPSHLLMGTTNGYPQQGGYSTKETPIEQVENI